MPPTINVALLRKMRGLVEEGSSIGLDEKEKLMNMLKQDCLLQDLTELFNCMTNNLIYN